MSARRGTISSMDEIIKVWIYAVTEEGLKFPDCKPSSTNYIVTKEVRGDFEYYRLAGDSIVPVTRRDADSYEESTGKKVQLYRGYPTFMYDIGYRA